MKRNGREILRILSCIWYNAYRAKTIMIEKISNHKLSIQKIINLMKIIIIYFISE